MKFYAWRGGDSLRYFLEKLVEENNQNKELNLVFDFQSIVSDRFKSFDSYLTEEYKDLTELEKDEAMKNSSFDSNKGVLTELYHDYFEALNLMAYLHNRPNFKFSDETENFIKNNFLKEDLDLIRFALSPISTSENKPEKDFSSYFSESLQKSLNPILSDIVVTSLSYSLRDPESDARSFLDSLKDYIEKEDGNLNSNTAEFFLASMMMRGFDSNLDNIKETIEFYKQQGVFSEVVISKAFSRAISISNDFLILHEQKLDNLVKYLIEEGADFNYLKNPVFDIHGQDEITLDDNIVTGVEIPEDKVNKKPLNDEDLEFTVTKLDTLLPYQLLIKEGLSSVVLYLVDSDEFEVDNKVQSYFDSNKDIIDQDKKILSTADEAVGLIKDYFLTHD